MEDVVHINLTDPSSEQVYCHLMADIVKFDGPFVAKTCWICPYWTGLAQGYGVECTYDDANANANPMKFSKPSAAKAEAGEAPDDPASIASQAGIAALDSRTNLPSSGSDDGSTPEEGSPEEEAAETPEEEQAEPADQGQPPAAGKGQVPPPEKPKAPVPPVPEKKKVPPQFLPKQKSKSDTAVDVVSEITKQLTRK